MKQIIFRLCVILILFSILSCKKQEQTQQNQLRCNDPELTCYHFDTSEITQTNYRGNIIGSIQPNQWTLQPLSQATDFDKNVFKNTYGLHANDFEHITDLQVFRLNNYNQNCTLNDTSYFTFVCYPNPAKRSLWNDSSNVQGACYQYFKISTNLNVKCVYTEYVDRFGDGVGGGGLTLSALPDGSSLTPILVGERENSFPSVLQRDYILYYFIYTLEGCVYFGKGNVIGC